MEAGAVNLRRRRRTIPNSDAATLRRIRIRTSVVRVALGALVCALAAGAFLSARDLEPRASELLPGGRSGVLVIDLSLSIVNDDYADVHAVLERLIKSGNPMGLVVFSDVAYELLPPRSPSNELRPLLRYFTPRGGRLPPNPWTPNFQAGTRISAALDLAYGMLRRDRVSPSSIVLVSDLETAPADYTGLGKILRRLRSSSASVRVVALSPSSDALTFFGGILGEQVFVDPVEPNTGELRPLEVSLRGETPLALLVASGLVLFALAAYEGFAGRLALPAGSGWRGT